MSLTDKLSNLHILLRAKSFERWPLQVRFFAADVFKFWERCNAKATESVRDGIRIGMDESVVVRNTTQPIGIDALDVTFAPMKPMLEKSRTLLAGSACACSVCHESLDSEKSLVLVCTADECKAASHLDCLSKHFLNAEHRGNAIVPLEGECPTCKAYSSWKDLVTDLSLRVRGEKEAAALFKVRKSRKKAGTDLSAESVAVGDDDDSGSELSSLDSDIDLDDSGPLISLETGETNELQSTQGSDEWHNIDDILSHSPKPLRKTPGSPKARRCVEMVIEDSDWDEAEIVE